MTTYVLPLLATAAASALTYLFCVRPMRRGRACPMPATVFEPVADAELDALRQEVARLRHRIGAESS
ncbi:hypothetical protein [Streptomyces olivaceoviridis]|uniref:hypothetical protein n=1 Tax=Streptomyces olivaceoviridis TaxID=1921 RepID=UPI0036F73B45